MSSAPHNATTIRTGNADYLRFAAAFSYDPTTGALRRRLKGGRLSDREAGSIGSAGYRRVILDKVEYYAHRVAWLLQHGSWPAGLIDHKSQKKADNRLENLRVATPAQNLSNRAFRPSKSGVQGVCFYKRTGKWVAKISVNSKSIHLGYFDDLETAARVRREAADKLHGVFACHGPTTPAQRLGSGQGRLVP